MSSGVFRIVDRVNTDEICKEWAEEGPADDHIKPMEGWRLKFYKIFEGELAILLFENAGNGKDFCYRWYIWNVTDEGKLEPGRKICSGSDGWKIDAFAYDGIRIFLCETNAESGEHRYGNLPVEKDTQKNRKPWDFELKDLSSRYFLLYDEPELCLVEYPLNVSVGVVDMDICDTAQAWNMETNGKKAAGTEADDDDGPEEDNVDGDNIMSRSSGEAEEPVVREDPPEIDDDEQEDGEEAEETVTTEALKAPEEKEKTEAEAGPEEKPGQLRTGFDELNEMIGLTEVKAQVDRLVAFAKMQKALAEKDPDSIKRVNMNMVFMGSPGTAKTTVARLFARILKENGILSKGELIETGRSQLIAKFVGHTAPKVRDAFEKAKGSLLFIDEAYSLVDGNDREFGDEAIATIVQEMENRRDDMVVIFAGYTDKMEEFLSSNPGLRSRIPFIINFDDYSADELLQIAGLEAGKRGFSIAPDAEDKIRDICAEARENKEFGNGRFSRNLVENAMMSYAMRNYGLDAAAAKDDFVLIADDFVLPESMKSESKVAKIGFAA